MPNLDTVSLVNPNEPPAFGGWGFLLFASLHFFRRRGFIARAGIDLLCESLRARCLGVFFFSSGTAH